MKIAVLVVALAAFGQTQPPVQSGGAIAPVKQDFGKTPAECLDNLKTAIAARQQAAQPVRTDATQALTALTAPVVSVLQQISRDRIEMAKACAAKYPLATTPDGQLQSLVEIDTLAGLPDDAKAVVEKLLTLKNLPEKDRAFALQQQVTIGLREPKSDERNARLEKIVDELDKLSKAVLDSKFQAHFSMNGYYRYDDIDAGIMKHSLWLINTLQESDPALRKMYAPRVVSSYVNMAEVLAGQGMNDKAIEYLRRAPKELSDVPTVSRSVDPELERLQLVGTPAAILTAPRWLNMPAGKTTLDLKGKVTMLEFSAHWCVPCKESYPGVNRLREKYGPQGFQFVLATKMYGYFEKEQGLSPDVEFERDRTYFEHYGMDVPIAVADRAQVKVVDGKVETTDLNDANYKVGGIPQIHLIDKQGRIRLVMVGYDDANEPKLAKMIEAMLKEK